MAVSVDIESTGSLDIEGREQTVPSHPVVAPLQTWRHGWLLIFLLVVGVYVSARHFVSFLPFQLSEFIAQPLLWLTVGGTALLLLRRDRRRVLQTTQDMVLLGGAIGAITVGVSFLVGTILEFGYSPYPHNLEALLRNFFYIGGILVGREIARWYLVTSLQRWGELPSIGITWLLFWLSSIPLGQYSQFDSVDTSIALLGSLFLPAAAIQLLATYLALRGGPLASIAYLGIMLGFEWFSPILPNLGWPALALIGVLIPLAGLRMLELDGRIETGETVEGDVEGSISWGWLAGASLLVVVVWFNGGVFGVTPAVVHGTSMLPSMETGDIAITRTVDADELEIGDIIRFNQAGRVILHRIIDITYDADGRMVVIAQGDNNAGADPPVPVEDVEGRLVRHVPHVGMPAIYLKQGFGWLTGR